MSGGKQRWLYDPSYYAEKGAKETKRAITPSSKIKPTPEPSPLPTPLEIEEMETAKTKVRGRGKGGRFATILAGRLMSRYGEARGKMMY